MPTSRSALMVVLSAVAEAENKGFSSIKAYPVGCEVIFLDSEEAPCFLLSCADQEELLLGRRS